MPNTPAPFPLFKTNCSQRCSLESTCALHVLRASQLTKVDTAGSNACIKTWYVACVCSLAGSQGQGNHMRMHCRDTRAMRVQAEVQDLPCFVLQLCLQYTPDEDCKIARHQAKAYCANANGPDICCLVRKALRAGALYPNKHWLARVILMCVHASKSCLVQLQHD